MTTFLMVEIRRLYISESTTWQFQFIGLGNHMFLYCNLTSDLTQDNKEFYISVCPFQILREPKSRLRSIVGSSPDNSLNMHLMGKKYLEFMLQPDSVNMDIRKEVALHSTKLFKW